MPVRVTSELWVAALIRRCQTVDAPAVVVNRGAAEAGAIFLVIDRLDGRVDLYGPAPQAIFLDQDDGERQFELLVDSGSDADVNGRLARERSFDSDLWVVAIEDRAGRRLFETP